MDPRYTFRKGYDTDLLILRSLFALNPNTNLPISSFYTPVADGIGGVQWLSLNQYFSAGTGILNFVSSVQSFSTVTGLYSNFSTQSSSNFITSNITTFFISAQSVQLSTLGFLDRRGNSTQILSISSGDIYLNDNLYYPPLTVTRPNLVSTVAGLGTVGYLSTSQLVSTTIGLINYTNTVGTAASNYTNTVGTASSNFTTASITTASNVLSNYTKTVGSNNSNYTTTSITTASNALTSNINNTSNYFNTFIQVSIVSTTEGVSIPAIAFPSTVQGLATAGYISSSQLQSTVLGLGGSGTVSTGQLVSSVIGLGTAGYISSSQLISTVLGLGGTGLVSTGQLVSTTIALSNLIIPASGITGANLFSTVAGLGQAGYVSSSQLASTVDSLNNNFYVQNASQVFVNNSRLNISSVGTFIFFSTFMNSSITYQGNNGNFTASNAAGPTAPFYFSSAILNLDRWSSFINAQSIITIEAFPTFSFANLGLPSANPAMIFMSSFIQGGLNFTSSQMAQTSLYPSQYTANRSNSFYQPMKITLPGAVVQGFYPNPMRLAHYLPNALTVGVTQGFSNNNISIFYGSTNSLFLSIQNLPL